MAYRIGVISDTHGLLRPEVAQAFKGVGQIIHAGDVGSPLILEALNKVAPVTVVRGNTDSAAWARGFPPSAVVEIGGVHLYVLHNLAELDLDAAAGGFAAVIYGHSHRQSQETRGGVLYFNPGSAGPRRFSLPASVGRITIEESGTGLEIRGEIIPLPDVYQMCTNV
ncbi:MAG: metallophosphatase family protein [Acidobacteriota bacterium]|jgi:putative phosphoesterase|nr:metallophosphatase family protein [Acidobacteriota bacterium]